MNPDPGNGTATPPNVCGVAGVMDAHLEGSGPLVPDGLLVGIESPAG